MDQQRFIELLYELARSRIAASKDLRGCSDAEIDVLEARYGLRLPSTYRNYLEIMGHCSGRLFAFDHMAVFYPHVLVLTDEFREGIRTGRHPGDPLPPPNFALPSDALIIAARLDAWWAFIRCSDRDDSVVWNFNENDWEIKKYHVSVLAWLEGWRDQAKSAIASGYFDMYPNGTSP